MLVATLGGVGRLRPGPGTWGSAVVLPCALLGPGACLVLAMVVTVAGWWAASRVVGEDDPGWFVADEAAGMLLALAVVPAGSVLGVALAFVLFRVFDIVKPWPVSWADQQAGAAGVMLDDLIAGGMAAGLIWLLGVIRPDVLA